MKGTGIESICNFEKEKAAKNKDIMYKVSDHSNITRLRTIDFPNPFRGTTISIQVRQDHHHRQIHRFEMIEETGPLPFVFAWLVRREIRSDMHTHKNSRKQLGTIRPLPDQPRFPQIPPPVASIGRTTSLGKCISHIISWKEDCKQGALQSSNESNGPAGARKDFRGLRVRLT